MTGDSTHCDWCGRAQEEVRALIAGPTQFICEYCVAICAEAVIEALPVSRPRAMHASDIGIAELGGGAA